MSNATFSVQRQATIGAPASRVLQEIVDFRRWVNWSPWEGMDPNQQRTYSGSDSGVGARYAWLGSRKVGQGEMEIIRVDPNGVDINLRFIKPFKANNDTKFAFAETNGQTTVTWTMTGKQNLINKIMGIFMSMDKLVGKDFEKGLTQLKALVEETK